MFASLPARWLALVPAMGALAAMARPAPTPDESAATPTSVHYQSVLEGYLHFADDKPIPWKTANETVLRRGGWQSYAKEAQSPAADDGTRTATPPPGQDRR